MRRSPGAFSTPFRTVDVQASTWRVLTRHFFNSLFDFGFLSDAGAESFKRLLMGMAAVALGLGLILLRVFAAKYIALGESAPDEYLRNLLADHAFLMAIPMWVAATTTVFVGHSLFPDENDFRILMALPLTRPVVFGAKLAALCLFVALSVAAVHVALAPLIGLTMFSPRAETNMALHAAAFVSASLTASAFGVFAIVALHGLLVLVSPRSRLVSVGTFVRSALLSGLVLALPLLLRLPGTGRAFEVNASWLAWVPPAWFVSLERWLLGDNAHASHAGLAIAATAMTLVVAALSYAVLYQRFDRVTVRPAGQVGEPRRGRLLPTGTTRPVRLAVRTFAAITLRRSVLHQGIVVALAACAAGFIVNDVYAHLVRPAVSGRAAELARAGMAWAPFPLILISSIAVRLALTVPIELRANWIFRMTEDPATRSDAVGAAAGTVFRVGVVLPGLLAAPVQSLVLGRGVWIALAVELAAGWLLVEILMRDWRRLPFTCAYVPGKGFVPQMFVKGLFGFSAFTSLGATFVLGSLAVAEFRVVVAVVTLAPALVLFIRRRRASAITDLAFEDDLPTEVRPLRLHD
jgi:hypothetical protein